MNSARCRRARFAHIACLCGVFVAFDYQALAQLPAASSQYNLQAASQINSAAGSVLSVYYPNAQYGLQSESSSDVAGDSVAVSASIAPTPSPTLSLALAINSPTGDSGGMLALDFAVESYSFEVLGPVGPVQIVVSSNGSFATSSVPASLFGATPISSALYAGFGGAYPFVDVPQGVLALDEYTISSGDDSVDVGDETLTNYRLDDPDFDPTGYATEAYQATGSDLTGFEGSYSDDYTLTLQTNVVYNVSMDAQLSAFFSGSGSFDASASVDPTFSLSPSVPDPAEYDLVFSPGIGNSVPDCGTAAGLFALSFAALALLRRKFFSATNLT